MEFKTINPFNGMGLETYSYYSDERIVSILKNSNTAFESWRTRFLNEKLEMVKLLSEGLISKKEEFARLMALEMGKPVKDGISEVEKCAKLCGFYIDNAEKFLTPEVVSAEYKKSFISFEPIGTVLAIMPWNFPFWQVFRFSIPSIIAGNTVVLKHSPNTTGCSLAIEKLFAEAGFPRGVFSSIIADLDQTSKVIESFYIKGVTLTGSARAGRSVASNAGAHLKKCVIELGGSDPYIVLGDADLDKASDICIASRMFNCGQTCISAKRFILLESIAENFIELMFSKMSQITFGNPLDYGTVYGPLARADIRDSLCMQIQDSIKAGAKCLLGGKIPSGAGFFYEATLLDKVTPDMRVFREETFGPVAPIIAAKNEEEAIMLANDTVFGLGAAVFTRDIEKGLHIAQYKLNSGTCVVNDLVRSDHRLPFGGIKESGFGRELSYYGMREFQNIKTIYAI